MQENFSLVELFLDENFILGGDNLISTSVMFATFLEWCRYKKVKPLSRITFTKEVKAIAQLSECFIFVPRKNNKADSHFQSLTLK